MFRQFARPPAWALVALVVGAGCPATPPPAPPARPFAGVKLTVAVLDEPGLVTLVGAQRGEWVESQGAVVDVSERPLSPPYDLGGIDVVLFPGDRLGDLIDAGGLVTIPDTLLQSTASTDASGRGPMAFNEVFPAIRDQATRYGSERVALPLGSSALVLAYRKDVLERPEVRLAAEEAGIKLTPPETWEQLDALAGFLSGRDWDGDGQPDHGIALPLGLDADGAGNALFLARAASLGQHPDHFSFLYDADTMASRVASPPFEEALSALVALREFGPPGMEKLDADAARAAFRAGKVALLIDRAERVAEWVDPKGPSVSVSVAQLPGSARVFEPGRKVWEKNVSPPNRPSFLPRGGGWMVGVVTASDGKQRDAAFDLAAYLASAETAMRTYGNRDLPMLPVRSSLAGRGLAEPSRAKGADGRRWSDAVQKTFLASRVIVGPRIPEADADMADLDAARAAASAGEDVGSVLADLARSWDERTRVYGTERRKWHYRRSLNDLSSTPKPPPRASVDKGGGP
jgi:multiple sugar transport system substrate-binding protein